MVPCRDCVANCCHGCRTPIYDQYYTVIDTRAYHNLCVQCCVCRCRLDQQGSCYLKHDAIFCRDDYVR